LRFPDHFGPSAPPPCASPTAGEPRARRWVAVTQRGRKFGSRFVGRVGAPPAPVAETRSLGCEGARTLRPCNGTGGIEKRDTSNRPAPRGGRGDLGQIKRVGGLPADLQAAGHVVSWRGWGVSRFAGRPSWKANGPNGPVSGTRIKESQMSPRSRRTAERPVAVALCMMLMTVGIAVLAAATAHAGQF